MLHALRLKSSDVANKDPYHTSLHGHLQTTTRLICAGQYSGTHADWLTHFEKVTSNSSTEARGPFLSHNNGTAHKHASKFHHLLHSGICLTLLIYRSQFPLRKVSTVASCIKGRSVPLVEESLQSTSTTHAEDNKVLSFDRFLA